MSWYGKKHFGHSKIKNRVELTTTDATTLFAAPGENLKNWISKMSLSTNDPTLSTEIDFYSEATKIWTCKLPFDGGNEPEFPDPIDGEVNERIRVACTVAPNAPYVIKVSAAGYRSIE